MTKLDPQARRALIKLTPLPHPRHDAVAVIDTGIAAMTMRVRYVPDRHVIDTEAFADYVAAARQMEADSLSALAQTILEDLNDQVIPCWLEVRLTRTTGGITEHAIIEDKQPLWQDRGILARLGT